MKHLKKIMALVIAMVMMVAGVVAVQAANATISIMSGDTHNYDIYQIFTGDLSGNVLSNIHYGSNAKLPTGKTVGDLVDKTVLDTMAAISGTDAEKAAALKEYADLTKAAAYSVNSGSTVEVPTGYYLIKDKDAIASGDEATLYILEVVGPTEIQRKAGTTESDKTVDDANDSDSTAALNGQGQKSSDYDIGDDVPYHVTATISEKVEEFAVYKIELEDILESGSFESISLDKTKVKIGNDLIGTFAENENFTVDATWNTDPTEAGFKVTFTFTAKTGKTLASLANKVIAIDFTAKLDEGAKIGDAGNKNTLKTRYSNNPNSSDSWGTIPDKVVITFTYKVIVNKVDQDNNALGNAGFTLYKVSKADAEAGVPDANATDAASKNAYWATKALANGTWADNTPAANKTSFSFEGVDDGYYVLCETTTPAGYNTVDPQVFYITGTHDADGITLTDLTGTKLNGSDITFTKDTREGSLTATIKNNQGTTLPETGGIGTTIFYVIGAILVLGAGILLVTRRRVSAN